METPEVWLSHIVTLEEQCSAACIEPWLVWRNPASTLLMLADV
jgi:hypothetical protein